MQYHFRQLGQISALPSSDSSTAKTTAIGVSVTGPRR